MESSSFVVPAPTQDPMPAAPEALRLPSLPAASPIVIPEAEPVAHTAGTVLLAMTATSSPLLGEETDIKVENTGSVAQTAVPITFGQVFIPGHIKSTDSLVGKLGDGTIVPLQFEVKAKHADGSIRHAIISAVVPRLAASATQAIHLVKSTAAGTVPSPETPDALLSSGFSAAVTITLSGKVYTASAESLLKNASRTTWLAGSIANEWLVSAPLKSAEGANHPHLTARFAVRSYSGLNKARVDFTIENNWAFEPNPQNFVYDVKLTVGAKEVYSKTALTHYNHARWRKTYWWGAEPHVNLKHNVRYLIASKAVPNYDQSVVVAESYLAGLAKQWTGAKIEPMGVGQAMVAMGTTGGRPDIGLMPGWATAFLLSQDKRARDVTLTTADLAGSWSAHYRNRVTDRPVTLQDFPFMTILGNPGDTYNPATKLRESFPTCTAANLCTTVNKHDSSHQPGFAYLPYLVTGDYYYLEELQFWAMWNTFSDNPAYRDAGKGLLKPDQVRGQAWSLRTLAEAAFITPDNDSLKMGIETLLSNNLDYYNAAYTNNPNTNIFGAIINGYAMVYNSGTSIAPWMDDFFTSAVGHTAELGYVKAKVLLAWKAKFPVWRMGRQDACWIDGALYEMKVRESSTAPFYTSLSQAYLASHSSAFLALPCGGVEMAAQQHLRVGEMTGYSSTEIGFPSNLQPALAYSVDSGVKNAAAAWAIFAGRSVKPNYGLGPQFAIIPR